MKTIKEIANSVGINKQKVYRYIKNNHINGVHQKSNVMYCDETAEKAIIQHFSKHATSNEVHQCTSNDVMFDVVINMLKSELEIKNKQIAELTSALENTTESLKAAQALHIGTMQQALLPEPEVTSEKPRKKIWDIFKKR